jgi:hypothetical protein
MLDGDNLVGRVAGDGAKDDGVYDEFVEEGLPEGDEVLARDDM